MDNKAHSGKVKISLKNDASIKECKDTNVFGHGERAVANELQIPTLFRCCWNYVIIPNVGQIKAFYFSKLHWYVHNK